MPRTLDPQEIRELAYEMWTRRDPEAGTPEEDWLRAEQQLLSATIERRQQMVDESVRETFPASDPPASRLPDVPPANAEAKWRDAAATGARPRRGKPGAGRSPLG